MERFRRVYFETSREAGRFQRSLHRVFAFFDSFQGVFVGLVGLPIMFGTFFAIILGAAYGPWAFLGIFGSLIGGLAFYIDRKMGGSLQFGEYSFWRRTLATVAGFVVALGLVFFLLTVSRLALFL